MRDIKDALWVFNSCGLKSAHKPNFTEIQASTQRDMEYADVIFLPSS